MLRVKRLPRPVPRLRRNCGKRWNPTDINKTGKTGGTKTGNAAEEGESTRKPTGPGAGAKRGDQTFPTNGNTATARRKKEIEPPAPTPDMGRGGAQHQAIQQRLKAVGEGLGFRATVEKPVPNGQGSIDLTLEKPGHAIACEINVTSTIDYEVGNASKCLKAGFAKVAVICANADRLSRLAETMRGCFSADQISRIGFYSPDDFISYLQTATLEEAPPSGSAPTEERKRGYKVKRSIVQLSPEEAKAKEDSVIKLLAERMRKNSES